jgi:hypothetical protein
MGLKNLKLPEDVSRLRGKTVEADRKFVQEPVNAVA